MSSIADVMEQHLRPEQLSLLRRASKAAPKGVELYLVGGTVRDLLSLHSPADLDLVWVGDDQGFPEALAEDVGGQVVERSEFGTCKLNAGGLVVDLVQARTESYANPGALPTVVPGTIEGDLARRDFSINAIAASLDEDGWGELLDPFEGERDLREGVVRVLHPKSFADDATRILRAVRYVVRMEYRLEEGTEQLLTRDLGQLEGISGDRVRHELQLFFREDGVGQVFQIAQEMGVLAAVHPALKIEPAALAGLQAAPVEPTTESELRLLALLVFSVADEEHSSLIDRLNMDGRWAKVVRDVGRVRDSFEALGREGVRRSEVQRVLRRLDEAAIEGCALAAQEPSVSGWLELHLKELRHVKPLLNGNDLMVLGVPQGPDVGRLLEELLTARLDGLLSSREDEERLVQRSLGG